MELRLLNTKEVSVLLKIHPETVRRFIREGRISHHTRNMVSFDE